PKRPARQPVELSSTNECRGGDCERHGDVEQIEIEGSQHRTDQFTLGNAALHRNRRTRSVNEKQERACIPVIAKARNSHEFRYDEGRDRQPRSRIRENSGPHTREKSHFFGRSPSTRLRPLDSPISASALAWGEGSSAIHSMAPAASPRAPWASART